MAERPACTHLTKDGLPCKSLAVITHPAFGPLCSRHAGLVRRQAHLVEDRTAAITCRVTVKEREYLRKSADFLDVSLSELIRLSALKRPLPAPKPHRLEALLLREWNTWGRNLNQVAHVLNQLLLDPRNSELQLVIREALETCKACWVELNHSKRELIRFRTGEDLS